MLVVHSTDNAVALLVSVVRLALIVVQGAKRASVVAISRNLVLIF